MLSINSLAYSYPSSEKLALVDISLTVKKSSLFGLLGPNGAGKTTLLSLLSGQLQCRQDVILLDGVDIRKAKVQGFSLIPQEYAFYGQMSVAENLRFFARIQNVSKTEMGQRIAEVVDITQLQNTLKSNAAQLSGGLKRRLNLAIGLLNRPKLLLLDEPTVGIDPHSRRFILDAIKTINANGTTIIYTSHYMEEVEYLCNEIAIIDHGRVLALGSLQELLGKNGGLNEGRQLTVELTSPLTETQLLALQAQCEVSQDGRHLSLRSERSSEAVYTLFAELSALQLEIAQCHYGSGNLEELFMQLTQRSLRD